MSWLPAQTHGIGQEIHFDGRRLRCFQDRPPHLDAMLRQTASRYPGREALVLGDQRLSYSDFDAAVSRVAGNLYHGCGVRRGDRVALLMNNALEFAIAFFACARLGAIAVPIGTRLQTPELAFMLKNSGARVLIAQMELVDRVAPALPDLPDLAHRFSTGGGHAAARPWDLLLADSAPAPAQPVQEEDVACILYTSGTTGLPKGACITHFNLAHSVMHYQRVMELTEADRSLVAVPIFHVTGLVAQLLTMVYTGGCTVLLPEFKVERFLQVAQAERMTHTLVVPTIYVLCLRYPRLHEFDLSAWRVAGYGGAPMPESTIVGLAERFPGLRLFHVYGTTETSSPTTMLPAEQALSRPGSCGLALPCAELKVVGPDGQELPPGEAGELWIKGPMVIPGYWDNPEANRKNFTEGFWHSGDLARIDPEGYVYILDRIKDMVNRGGFKVYCIEVENVLYQHPDVLEAAVVGVPDPVLGERVRAVIVPREGHAVDPDDVRRFCAARLADYKVPEQIRVVESLPRNPSGKVLKQVLRTAE